MGHDSSTDAEKAVNRSHILSKAAQLTLGDRQQAYGSPKDNHQRIADLWSTYLKTPITAQDAAICMALVKVARLMQTPDHLDSFIDLAAYAAIAGEIATEEEPCPAESAPSLTRGTTATVSSFSSSSLTPPATLS